MVHLDVEDIGVAFPRRHHPRDVPQRRGDVLRGGTAIIGLVKERDRRRCHPRALELARGREGWVRGASGRADDQDHRECGAQVFHERASWQYVICVLGWPAAPERGALGVVGDSEIARDVRLVLGYVAVLPGPRHSRAAEDRMSAPGLRWKTVRW